MATLDELIQQQQGRETEIRETQSLDVLVENAQKSNPLLIEQPATAEQKKGGFFKSLFSETYGLGETISAPFTSNQFVESERMRENFLNKITGKIRSGEIDTETARTILKMTNEDIPKIPEVLEKTGTQVAGEVLGTALWITPFNEIKALKGMSIFNRTVRGATLGGSFAAAHGLSEGAGREELAQEIALGAMIGAPLEVFAPVVFKGMGKIIKGTTKVGIGGVKLATKLIPKPIREMAITGVERLIYPIETRLRNLGPHGAEIADRFLASDSNALRRTGTELEAMEKAGLFKLNDAENFALLDALEGRLNPKSLSSKVLGVFNSVDITRKKIGTEAVRRGIKIKLKRGIEKPFIPRKDFYPHSVPELKKLKQGKFRDAVIDNSVRVGRFRTKADAELVLDSFIKVVETEGRGTRGEWWVEHLISTGQAKNKEEAIGMTLRFFKPSRNQRFGHLERARELDFPFYDPDVRRQFPLYVSDAVARLEKVGEFGKNGEKLSSLLAKLQGERVQVLGAEQGKSATLEARTLTDKIFGVINASDKRQQLSLFLRAVQIPKLAFAQILNLGQNLNTLLATDLSSLSHGLYKSFTDEGVSVALRSGAILESLLRETATLGGDVAFNNLFLKYTGFSWTEKFNRTVAANAGMKYAQRLRNKLLKNPADEQAKRLLSELGVRTTNLGKDFTEKELLQVSQKMSFLTQFRARPIDLPAFASSPEGKIIFQYKNFIFNQTKFIKNQIAKEARAGDYGRLTRALFILGTVFPMTGEVIADIRSLITGSTRPTNFLDRYFENLINTGAVGIWGDMIQSAKFDDLAGFAVGPTADTFFEISEAMYDIGATGEVTDAQKRLFIRQPGITRPLANFLFPPQSKERETILETLSE